MAGRGDSMEELVKLILEGRDIPDHVLRTILLMAVELAIEKVEAERRKFFYPGWKVDFTTGLMKTESEDEEDDVIGEFNAMKRYGLWDDLNKEIDTIILAMYPGPKITVLGNYTTEDHLIELDGPEPPAKKPKTTFDLSEMQSVAVEYKQPPVISSIYSDPETKQIKCLVVILLFSNIKNIEFDVLQGVQEQTLKITYQWPQSSFNVTEMFKKEGASQTFVHKMHPKFLSTEMALQNVRENFEEAPLGTIEVKLPVSVQMEPSTWSKYFNKKRDGTLLVFFEFQCIRDDYIISKAEKSLSFE